MPVSYYDEESYPVQSALERQQQLKPPKHRGKRRRNNNSGTNKKSSSWFSIIFIFSICVILLYSCRQIYLYFPSNSEEGRNNDDVVKVIINNEEAEVKLADSIKQYEDQYRQHEYEQQDNTYTSSGSKRSTPHHSVFWIWRHLNSYFDLQPLRNVLIRGGLYSSPPLSGPGTAMGAEGHESDAGGPGAVYQIDTNSHLSDEQKTAITEQETDFIAKRLQERSDSKNVV